MLSMLIFILLQGAAQATLQTGWSILLPTAEERAKALSSLLPSTGKIKEISWKSFIGYVDLNAVGLNKAVVWLT